MILPLIPHARLTYLIEKASEGNVKSAIAVKSWPRYLVLELDETHIRYSVAWEAIFESAETNHERNLRAVAAENFLGRKKANC